MPELCLRPEAVSPGLKSPTTSPGTGPLKEEVALGIRSPNRLKGGGSTSREQSERMEGRVPSDGCARIWRPRLTLVHLGLGSLLSVGIRT